VEFAVFDIATGEVVKAVSSTSARSLDLAQARMTDGQAIYLGHVDPRTHYLPGGVLTERVEDVVVSVDEVKRFAGRLLAPSDWRITRAQEMGTPIPPEVLTYRAAVRERSGEIEQMIPIPLDYRDAKYWPDEL